ncbi:MAG: sigma-70 family RNA polymerase sigma factor [Chitinophagaceae bacterium]|nr:sigma-70 family RNA polymerase sigma factor [Chitinophagaceae bacterium]
MMLLANSSPTSVERDSFLWREMKEGNEAAFSEIFDTYSNLLFQYGSTIINDKELIKDCVQELFIVIWSNKDKLGVARSIKYYLFFSLRRLVLKKAGKRKKFFSLSSFNHSSYSIEPPDHLIVMKEININHQLIISIALEKLPARQKEIIFLKFYQELKNEEIQIIMNLNNQVVRNTLCKALHSLRLQMKDWAKNGYHQLLITLFYFIF